MKIKNDNVLPTRKDIVDMVQALIPEGKKHTSNSALGEVKRFLIGERSFFGSERFLIVGKELHRRVLEPHVAPEKGDEVTADEDVQIQEMVDALLSEQRVRDILATSSNELVIIKEIYGIMIKGIIDIHSAEIKKGADLKTTSTRTEKAFVKSAKKYGYFRQAVIYMALADLDSFEFIAVTKKAPYRVFYLDVADYPEQMGLARQELKTLIEVVKGCGRLND